MEDRSTIHLPKPNTRREFLGKLGGTLGALTVIGGSTISIVGCSDDPASSGSITGQKFITVDVSALAVGSSLTTTEKASDGSTVLIVRKAEADFLAISMRCTHEACTIGKPTSAKTMICGCHGSKFSVIDGSVLNGPATSSLSRFTTKYDAATQKLNVDS